MILYPTLTTFIPDEIERVRCLVNVSCWIAATGSCLGSHIDG